jgi:hypothetical protein
MLFESYNLFEFVAGMHGNETRYGIPDPADDFTEIIDARNAQLGQLIGSGIKRLAYTYDFGDIPSLLNLLLLPTANSCIRALSQGSIARRPKTLEDFPDSNTTSRSWLIPLIQSMLILRNCMATPSIPRTSPKPRSSSALTN